MTTSGAAAPQEPAESVSTGYRYYVLAILVFVYMLNFVDRQIIGILAAPLKQEFQLSDSQFGLLGGIAFASVYSTLAIPLAWLADRSSRVWIMTGALTVWSGFTALCGVAGSFGQLFLFRMGVGVGEAGGVAPAYSLIADYFPPNQRARAMAAFAFGIPLGTAGGTLIGGLLAAHYGWRTAFIAVGLLGVLVAPLLRLTVRDPKRGGTDAAAAQATGQVVPAAGVPASASELPADDGLGRKVGLGAFGVAGGLALLAGLSLAGVGVATPLIPAFGAGLFAVIGVSLLIARRTGSVIMRKKSFWLLSLGAAASSVCGYGVAGWLPLFFMRSFDLTLAQVSWYYAGIALIGGLLGIWMGGSVADRLGRKSKGGYPLVPAVAFLISAPCFILAMNSPWLIGLLPGGGSRALALSVAFLIFLIPTGLNLAWLGPVTAAVQHLAPAPMRSTASAIFLLINNLLGLAVGFFYFGWMSDLLRPTFGEESLRWAIYTGMGFYLLSSALLFGASRTLKKDWVD
ncbi:MAG: MFS transporter [Candidatus Brevundimonas phytovorans]|nr:MFS transporter [Brevundimonas sp.]WEK57664.1 MAG: MFS transporter [Brevundimonas sp.]